MSDSTSEFVFTQGLRIHHRIGGAGDPIVLIHGHGETSRTWLDCFPLLAKHHLVCAIDMPGHGKSDKPRTEYSLSFMAEVVIDYLQAINVETCDLIGHSLGGAVVAQLTISFPSVARRLVLVDAPIPGVSEMRLLPTSLPLAIPGLGELFCILTPKSLHKTAGQRSYFNPSAVPERKLERILEDGYARLRRPEDRYVFLSSLRSAIKTFVLERRRFEESLSQLDNMTLIVHGRQDRLIPVAHARAVGQLLPGSTLRIIDNCGHVPQVEKTVEFCEEVLSFLHS